MRAPASAVGASPRSARCSGCETELFGYVAELRGATSGQGEASIAFERYERVAEAVAAGLVQSSRAVAR